MAAGSAKALNTRSGACGNIRSMTKLSCRRGPHRTLERRAALVQALNTHSRGASMRRVSVMLACHGRGAPVWLRGHDRRLLAIDHPRRAVLVGQHAELLRPEGLGQSHAHRSAFGQSVEHALGVLGFLEAEIDREALHRLVIGRRRVGAHQHEAVADDAGMDDLLAPFRRHVAFGRRALMRHHHRDLAAEDLRIGFEGLLAIAVEGEVGIDLHASLLAGLLASSADRTHALPR